MEVLRRTMYIHCGWSILVPPDLTPEYEADTGTLRLVDEHHEVSLSGAKIEVLAGASAREVWSHWPPKQFKGVLLKSKGQGSEGRAVHFEAASDVRGREWVLAGLHLAEQAGRLLHATLVVWRPTDRQWAVDLWRSVAYVGDDLTRMRQLYPNAIPTSSFQPVGKNPPGGRGQA